MNELVFIVNIATSMWLAIWACYALWRIMTGGRSAIYFLLIVLFVLNGVPLLLDILVGQPGYLRNPGFYTATRDMQTNIMYCAYMIAVPIIVVLIGNTRAEPSWTNKWRRTLRFSDHQIRVVRISLIIIAISPIILISMAPNPGIYMKYGTVGREFMTEMEVRYQRVVAAATMLSILANIGLLASLRKLTFMSWYAISPLLLTAIWFNGKRHIIAITIMLLLYMLWYRGNLVGGRFAVASIAATAILMLISLSYQESVRSYSYGKQSSRGKYESARIDYGRDDVVKMTLYAELHPNEMRILDYRGQSVLFSATFFVPRRWWPNKPMPYAQYLTSAMLYRDPQFWGWAMTTSWLEEAVANFSWVGLIVGPGLPALVCRLGDKYSNAVVGPLTVLVASLLLAVQIIAFLPVAMIWSIAVVLTRRQARRSEIGAQMSQPLRFSSGVAVDETRP